MTQRRSRVQNEVKNLHNALDRFKELIQENALLQDQNLQLRDQLEQLRTWEKNFGGLVEDGIQARRTPLESAERNTIVTFLVKTGYNQRQTSELLGIRQNTLINKIRKYNIPRPDISAGRKRKADPSNLALPTLVPSENLESRC
ncbi:MAG: hypothetical protein K8S54_10565 [Spirochaetia bacterium]|nr:hypothetical protein [Spirochaetia bacterium]